MIHLGWKVTSYFESINSFQTTTNRTLIQIHFNLIPNWKISEVSQLIHGCTNWLCIGGCCTIYDVLSVCVSKLYWHWTWNVYKLQFTMWSSFDSDVMSRCRVVGVNFAVFQLASRPFSWLSYDKLPRNVIKLILAWSFYCFLVAFKQNVVTSGRLSTPCVIKWTVKVRT